MPLSYVAATSPYLTHSITLLLPFHNRLSCTQVCSAVNLPVNAAGTTLIGDASTMTSYLIAVYNDLLVQFWSPVASTSPEAPYGMLLTYTSIQPTFKPTILYIYLQQQYAVPLFIAAGTHVPLLH